MTVDGQETSQITQVWVDASTRLPVRARRTTGTDLDYEAFYTYDRSRRTPSEAPADLFRVAAPPGDPDEEIDYATEPTPQPDTDPEPTLGGRVEEIASQRRLLGLDDSESFIRQTLNDPDLDATVEEFGLPLQPQEAALIRKRDATAEAGEETQEAEAARNPDDYAGMYIDYTTGDGLLFVGFKSNVEQNLAAFKAAYPYPERVRGFHTGHSLRDLIQLRDRVRADAPTLEAQDINVATIAVDPKNKAVAIGVTDLTPAKAAELTSKYGNGILAREQAPAVLTASRVLGPFSSTPGGIKIQRRKKGSDDLVSCSSGFSAQGTGAYRSRRYVLTAGHCGFKGTEFSRDRNGQIVGTVAARRYGGQLDAALIRADRGEASNRILLDASGGKLRYRRITKYARPKDNFFELKRRCFVGYRHSYPRCGVVGNPSDVKYCDEPGGDCRRIEDQSTLSVGDDKSQGAFKGDSGGAVFYKDVAFGLVSGTSSDHAVVYSTPISRALDAFTVNLYGQ